MTKLSSSVPEGDANGLTAITRQLVDEPHRLHVVVAIVDCNKVTTDHDKGSVIPTARLRRVEVVTFPEDKQRIRQLMQRAYENRTGAEVLPLDLEDELRAAFEDIDPATGEIRDTP